MTPEQMLQHATQFRLPLTNTVGGYGEIVIERGEGPHRHKWAITDGAFTNRQIWIEAYGGWTPASSISLATAYDLTLDEAFKLGQRVVEIETARLEAEINSIPNA